MINADPARTEPQNCRRIDRAFGLLGRSRCGTVIAAALAGASRYRDYTAAIPGVSHAVLSARLRELVALGVLEHREGLYTPTELCRAFEPTLTALESLVAQHPHPFNT